ncbi:MAG: hypothetical protein AB7J35_11380 [Dehalococcoidia bacterium]
MTRTFTVSPRRLVLIAAFGLVAMAAFGFAASNNVDPSNAGDGSEAVSGGDVTNIHYIVSANQVTGVSFDYDADTDAPSNVSATLEGPDVTDTCDEGPSGHWTCDDFAAQSIASITGLRVVSFD